MGQTREDGGSYIYSRNSRMMRTRVLTAIAGWLSLSSLGLSLTSCTPPLTTRTVSGSNAGIYPVTSTKKPVQSIKFLKQTELQSSRNRPPGIQLVFEPAHHSEYRQLATLLKESGKIAVLIDELNKTYLIPRQITVKLTDDATCDQLGSHYNSDKVQINLCYQNAYDYEQTFSKHVKSKQAVEEAILNTKNWDLLHEMGHAFVDVMNLPVTGKEEDVADEFATLILLESGDGWSESALSAAQEFLFNAEKPEELENALQDEHSLNRQRYRNILCFVYGSNPNKYRYMTQKGTLKNELGDRCIDEYHRKVNNWNTLLSLHFK